MCNFLIPKPNTASFSDPDTSTRLTTMSADSVCLNFDEKELTLVVTINNRSHHINTMVDSFILVGSHQLTDSIYIHQVALLSFVVELGIFINGHQNEHRQVYYDLKDMDNLKRQMCKRLREMQHFYKNDASLWLVIDQVMRSINRSIRTDYMSLFIETADKIVTYSSASPTVIKEVAVPESAAERDPLLSQANTAIPTSPPPYPPFTPEYTYTYEKQPEVKVSVKSGTIPSNMQKYGKLAKRLAMMSKILISTGILMMVIISILQLREFSLSLKN